jgi:predicted MFS family arabinose efflux permease
VTGIVRKAGWRSADPGGAGLDPISLMAVATFLVWADRQMVAPVLPAMARDFRVGIGAVAAVVSVYSVCYGLFEIAYGQLADRYGRIRVMVAALQVFAVGTLAAGLMPTLGGVVAMRGLTGAAAAAIVPLSIAYIGDTVPLARRQAAISRINTANALGQAFSVVLGGVFAQVTTWRAMFVIYGLAASVAAVLLRRAPESVSAAPEEPVLRTAAQLLRQPGVPALYLVAALEGGCILGAFVYLSPALKSHGYSYLLVGLALASFGATCLAGTRALPRLVAHGSPERAIWLGGAGIVAGYALAAAGGLGGVVACSALLGLGYAWLHSAMQTWATTAFPRARATAVSGYAFSLFVGAGLATQVLAPLADRGAYAALFLAVAAGGGLLTTLAAASYRRYVAARLAVART